MTLLFDIQRSVLSGFACALLVSCTGGPSKEEQEAAKNTFACELEGERVVVRFETGEARLLMPGGERVTLYQVSSGSGIRYTNGMMDLRGKGMELQLARDGGSAVPLIGCAPLPVPK